MLQIESAGPSLRLTLDGVCALAHRDDAPFVTALLREKTYHADRGTMKEEVRELARIPLRTLSREGDTLVFSGEQHALRVLPREIKNGVELQLQGEPGWAYEFRLPAAEGEAVFGGGEQYRQVNLRGETVVNFVSEHIKASTILEKAFLPRRAYKEKSHSQIGSYAPMPVFVTDRGRMILFSTGADGISVFGEDAYRFIFDACPEKLTLWQADSYAALSKLLTDELPNRQYLPDWCLDGMILGVQGGTETVLQKAFAMQEAGGRVCGVWCQDWSGENRTIMGKQVWWNWEVDRKLYPGLKEAIARLRSRGIRFLGYINPYLVKDGPMYLDCLRRGFLITRADGSVYHIKSTTFDAGMLDLTNPDAVRFIKDVLIKQNMLDLGMSGWMADFGEYLPVDCVLHEGDPKLLHNRWPVLWAKINREAIEEYGAKDVMFFCRSGYLGIQEYAPILWNGDQHTDTTRDYGMPCVMPASFSLGFSGVSFIHCDIGGFFSFGKLRRSGELFTRWMEMCCFSLLMRSHESIRPWANAQFDAPEVLPHFVRLSRIHAALRPYLEHCLEGAAEGVPAMRPDFWEAMSFSARHEPYAYFLGEDLFVAPVIHLRRVHRDVHLPEGEWVHFWTGRSCTGGSTQIIDAPLGRIPVFYRKGSPFASLFDQIRRDEGDF